MALLISDIKTSTYGTDEEIIEKALKEAGIDKSECIHAGVYKKSLDARKRNNIHIVSSVWVETDKYPKNLPERVTKVEKPAFSPIFGDKEKDGEIVVVGFGPAGMFAALSLSEYGYKPLVIERGEDADSRIKAVKDFWEKGIFKENSNVQFGEGGAGTFSDGKLTTRIHDPLCRYVLEKFYECNAPEDILTKAKPHLGTDNLREIVKNIRQKIIANGGKVRFNTALTGITEENGKVTKITVNEGEEIKTSAVILALGHSARDTFSMLYDKGIYIEPKPFSVGARIEHRRIAVNESLYGENYPDILPEGEYQLSYRIGNRGVYTFCMCPGGYVVPSQSEERTIVTNGMSEYKRNGDNSNSALVVSVSPEDFGKGAMDGIAFQRKIERKAYESSKSYKAPACTAGSFLKHSASLKSPSVNPSYALGVTEVNFDDIFPEFVTNMMREGLYNFGNKMKCFKDAGAILTAPETRTSSPVRLKRDENFASVSADNIYPCGEGAGYAGGIMSAAVDGLRAALKVMEKYKAK